MTIGWPFLAVLAVLRELPDARRKIGRRFSLGLAFDMLGQAWSRNIPPRQYARYVGTCPAARHRLDRYLFAGDVGGIAALSTRAGADLDDVGDKLRFANLCERNGLPAIETVAAFSQGKLLAGSIEALQGQRAVLVKPLSGSGGRGHAIWKSNGGAFEDGRGELLTVPDLVGRLAGANCIVQPLLEDHAELAGFGTTSLSTVRLVTAMSERARAIPIFALLNLDLGPAKERRRVIGLIDLDTGEVRRAFLQPDKVIADHYVLGGRPLVGHAISRWPEMLALALRAHQTAFPKFVSLGWDIAFPETGPLLVEANSHWGVAEFQTLAGPLGDTALATIIDQHLPASRTRASMAATLSGRQSNPHLRR